MADEVDQLITTKFHKFLVDNKAKKAWDLGRTTGAKQAWTDSRFFSALSPKDWIIGAFNWASSLEGLSYWNTLHNKWRIELRS